MSNVLLVVMPFAGVEAPQLGVSLLKAQLRSRGIPASVAYLNFTFAQAAGYLDYLNMKAQYCLAGEWMFARSLFPRSTADDEAYINHVMDEGSCNPELFDGIRRMASLVEPFLDHCLRSIDWDRYSVIGFTS